MLLIDYMAESGKYIDEIHFLLMQRSGLFFFVLEFSSKMAFSEATFTEKVFSSRAAG